MTSKKPVRGPMYIEGTPLMVTADVSPLVEHNLDEVLELLGGEFFEDFIAATCPESDGEHDGHAPEELRFERLREQLVERLAKKVALTGPQAVRTAERMAELGHERVERAERAKGASEIKHPAMRATRKHFAENPLPGQREAGAA